MTCKIGLELGESEEQYQDCPDRKIWSEDLSSEVPMW